MNDSEKIDTGSLYQAEQSRQSGDFAAAFAAAADNLNVRSLPLSAESLAEMQSNRAELATMAATIRMIFETLKSQAKREKTPWGTHNKLEEVMDKAGDPGYGNNEYRNAIDHLNTGPTGEEYDFPREMARDVADLLMVTAALYGGKRAQDLIQLAKSIWLDIIDSFDEFDDYSPGLEAFFKLEHVYFLNSIGLRDAINIDSVIKDLQTLSAAYAGSDKKNKNLDRVATLAARMKTVASSMSSDPKSGLLDWEAQKVLEKVAGQDPQYADREARERDKVKKGFMKQIILKVFGGVSAFPKRRAKLYSDVKNLGQYQYQRLNDGE